MSFGLIFLMSLCAVMAFLVLAVRLVGWQLVLRHASLIDVIFTVVICLALAGTLTGILIGIMAGLVLTVTLTTVKYLLSRVERVKSVYRQRTPVEDDGWEPKYGWERL